MNDKFQTALETLIPYLILGCAIALIVGLVFLFSYVLMWGLLIGAVLWLIALAKSFLFPGKKKESKGRIIDQNK